MLTIYSIVKGFVGEFAHIQHNAIRSWQKILPGAEIILFGDEEVGAQQEAASFGVPVLPLRYNEHGAPLIADVIKCANEVALYDVRCLVNADIILEPGFPETVQTVTKAFDAFLLSARRIKIRVDEEIDFDDENWLARLRQRDAKLGISSAIDLFCYRGGWMRDMPPFGVGRTSWDNWIVRKAHEQDVPFVDGSPRFLAWHQEHEKRKPENQVAHNRALLNESRLPGSGTFGSATWRIDGEGELRENRHAMDK